MDRPWWRRDLGQAAAWSDGLAGWAAARLGEEQQAAALVEVELRSDEVLVVVHGEDCVAAVEVDITARSLYDLCNGGEQSGVRGGSVQ